MKYLCLFVTLLTVGCTHKRLERNPETHKDRYYQDYYKSSPE